MRGPRTRGSISVLGKRRIRNRQGEDSADSKCSAKVIAAVSHCSMWSTVRETMSAYGRAPSESSASTMSDSWASSSSAPTWSSGTILSWPLSPEESDPPPKLAWVQDPPRTGVGHRRRLRSLHLTIVSLVWMALVLFSSAPKEANVNVDDSFIIEDLRGGELGVARIGSTSSTFVAAQTFEIIDAVSRLAFVDLKSSRICICISI